MPRTNKKLPPTQGASDVDNPAPRLARVEAHARLRSGTAPATGNLDDYAALSKVLHWTVALLLTAQFIIAWSMPDVGPDTRVDRLISLHMSLGIAIALVVIARLAARLTLPRALGPAPRWMRLAAVYSHCSMYILLILTPLLGWAAASAHLWTATFLGGFVLRPLIPRWEFAGLNAGDIHSLASYTLLSLIGIHISAALYHRLVLRDHVLARMLPRGPRWRYLKGESRK